MATPHGGARPFHQKTTCLTQSTSGPYVVQIWSRHDRKSERTRPSKSTVWNYYISRGSCLTETKTPKELRPPQRSAEKLETKMEKADAFAEHLMITNFATFPQPTYLHRKAAPGCPPDDDTCIPAPSNAGGGSLCSCSQHDRNPL